MSKRDIRRNLSIRWQPSKPWPLWARILVIDGATVIVVLKVAGVI